MNWTRIAVMTVATIATASVIMSLLARAHTDMNIPIVYDDSDALYHVTIFKAIGEGNLPCIRGTLP